MKKSFFPALCLFLSFGVLIGVVPSFAAEDTPPQIAAPLIVKLLPFEESLSSAESVKIYVIGDDALLAELSKAEGRAIGGSTLAEVAGGSGMPPSEFNVIIVNEPSIAGDVLAFCQEQKALSVTTRASISGSGPTLGIVVESGKPQILLNLNTTILEGHNWQKSIMKIAKTVQ
jgi:hypothetical protein